MLIHVFLTITLKVNLIISILQMKNSTLEYLKYQDSQVVSYSITNEM